MIGWQRFGTFIFLVGALSACGQGKDYRAEVGYHDGNKEEWWFGSDTTRENCTAEAIGKYNQLNALSPKRAFSWACLRVKGSRVLGRVR